MMLTDMIENVSLLIGFHAVFGLVLGFVLARLVIKTDEQHRGLSFSLLTLSLVKSPEVSYRLFQVFVGLLMALVFVLNAMFLDGGWPLLFWQLMSLFLVAAAVYDLAFRLIPVSLIGLLVSVSFFTPLFFGFPLPYWQAFGGALATGGLVLLLYLGTRGHGIGEADVFLAVVIGLMFGWAKGLLVFSAANVLGLLVVLPLVAFLGKNRMKQIPLVFFMVLAILLEWYLNYTEPVLTLIGAS